MTLFSLHGRVALVTGGAGHLGSALCRGLAQAGAHVLINGRTRDKVEALAAALRAQGHGAEALVFDVTDHASVARHIGALERLDVLVNNASAGRPGTIATTAPSAFGPAAAISAEAAYAAVLAALPAMRRHGGSVINIASMYGIVSPDPRIYGDSGYDSPPQYGAAKASLLQLTRYLACHLAPEGIRVNAVSPGPFPQERRMASEHPQLLRAIEEKVPMRRIGRPEELAGAIVFLASDASTYITGANIPVDGGWTAW
jgi:NAD(P)-dependent dehydrogenase (short-subunit alcohol dehydrogenase family)